MSAKPGSQRYRAAAVTGNCYQDLWKQQEMKLIKCSRLAQSHASLSTTSRASFWSQLSHLKNCTAKIKKIKKAKFIHRAETLSNGLSLGQGEERRKCQAGRGRKQKMSLQPAKVRTKMSAKPGSQRFRAAAVTENCHQDLWKQQEMRLIKCVRLTQSHASLSTTARASFWSQLSTLESCTAKFKKIKRRKSSIEQRLCQAASQHWARVKKEESVKLDKAGNKRCLHNQRKYVQFW